MALVQVDKLMRTVIENATIKGASRQELDILWEATELVRKYRPNVDGAEEFGKFVVKSNEKKVELV